jgi:hypothetical protein
VKDPREPFSWWQQANSTAPLAAVFAEPRDYDIVLVAGEVDDARPWRFSLRNGQVVDIVIETRQAAPGTLALLIPSVDNEPWMFLVIPAEKDRDAPRALSAGPSNQSFAKSAGVATPTFAPDGRTGDRAIDEVINALLHDDAAKLAKRTGYLAGREVRSVPNTDPAIRGDYRNETVRSPLAEWTQRLASGQPSLYAVFSSEVADVEIVLAVKNHSGAEEAWKFAVRSSEILEVEIHSSLLSPPPILQALTEEAVPSVPLNYYRFFVLPPREDLPVGPNTYPLSTRTGDIDVDRLIGFLESHDSAGLIASAASPREFVERPCIGTRSPLDATSLDILMRGIAAKTFRLNAVARVPPGWDPPASNVMILIEELNPYSWESLAIYERDGRIVGVSAGGYCSPKSFYPPATLLVAPPALGGQIDRERRSGIEAVDSIIDTLEARNEPRLASLIQYSKVPCSRDLGVGTPPKCPDGTPPGTPIDALGRGCEGSYFVPPTAAADLIRTLREPILYALVERPPAAAGGSPVLAATLIQGRGVTSTLLIANGRIVGIETTCPAPSDPIWQVRGAPDFLLPPP